MGIKKNIEEIKKEIKETQLVAVSKTKPNEDILEAYNSGHKIFGENKVQELVKKHEELPKDIKWHFIGHLQTNKVKYIAEFIDLIHAVDSIKLLKEINKQAKKYNRTIDCLLQIKIAEEDSKFGISENELLIILNSDEYNKLTNIQIKGIMGMATFTSNTKKIESEFAKAKNIYDKLKEKYFINDSGFSELSMGMSNDYKLAIKNGSTMIRVGSNIFGERNYSK
jgi:pyridoxal phosphate enzyme (YggS family)